jgi:hypothetical protein
MGRIAFGIFLVGLSLITDAYNQVLDFWRMGYADKKLREKVWDAIVTFSTGFLIVGGIVYFVYLIFSITD